MRIALIISLFISYPIFGQTMIDSIFSIQFPSNPEIHIAEDEKAEAIAFYLNSEKESFITMRITNGYSNQDLPSLRGLQILYEESIAAQIHAMERKRFEFRDTVGIWINELKGYRIIYQDSVSKRQNAESIILFINGITYVATYSKVNEFVIENKDRFLKSIIIDTTKNVKQFIKPYDFKRKIIELFISAIMLIILFYLWKKYKKLQATFCISNGR